MWTHNGMNTSPLPFPGLVLTLGALLLLAPAHHFAQKPNRLGPAERQFLQNEYVAGKDFVALATEAANQSDSEDVRAFARTLLNDHQLANGKLAKLAATKEVELETASNEAATPDERLTALRQLKGDLFNQEFLTLMIGMHSESIDHFEKATTDSPDLDLKKWADERLTRLKSHLDQANKLSPSKTANKENPHHLVL